MRIDSSGRNISFATFRMMRYIPKRNCFHTIQIGSLLFGPKCKPFQPICYDICHNKGQEYVQSIPKSFVALEMIGFQLDLVAIVNHNFAYKLLNKMINVLILVFNIWLLFMLIIIIIIIILNIISMMGKINNY